MGDISRWLNENNSSITETKLNPQHIADLINFIKKGKITGKIGKSLIDEIMEQGTSISAVLKKTGKQRISDRKKIIQIVSDVIKENPKIVEDYQTNPKALQALIGKCMKKTKGQIDPEITKEIMVKLLKN
jgi:aspartyl-tRNA(Asn)/glutamyl-tRNA(Gln) amidotransferase subunit B